MRNRSIIRSTVIVTIVTFIIKLLGLIKQSVLAAFCGATDETDAFFIASGVVFSLSTMLFSSISISLLTLHTSTLLSNGRAQANKLINITLRSFLPIAAMISALFFIGAPLISKCLAPAYKGEQLQILSHYVRLMSCVFIFTCYYLVVNVILETDKEFVPGRLYGLFQNVFLIIAAMLCFRSIGMDALLWAFVLSGFAECVLVTICAGKRLRFIWEKPLINKAEVTNLLKLSLPLIIGNALYEINDIVDKQISSSLGSGNASFLTYGATINEIVTGVVVGSVSIVLFSHFATWAAEGNLIKVEEGLNRSSEILTIIILPILAMCLFTGKDILKVLYGRGNFGDYEIEQTMTVVIGYALGFVFASIRANMVKVFYAFQDTKRPLVNGTISITINIVSSIILAKFAGIGGVAMATSIAMIASTILLFKQIKCHLPNYTIKESVPEYVKGGVACIVCSATLYYISKIPISDHAIKLFIESITGIGTYIFILYLVRARSLTHIMAHFHQRKK